MKIKATKIPARFASLINDLAFVFAVRKMCRQMGIALEKDDAEFRKEQRKKWNEARTFTTPKHRHKVRKLVIEFAKEQYGV